MRNQSNSMPFEEFFALNPYNPASPVPEGVWESYMYQIWHSETAVNPIKTNGKLMVLDVSKPWPEEILSEKYTAIATLQNTGGDSNCKLGILAKVSSADCNEQRIRSYANRMVECWNEWNDLNGQLTTLQYSNYELCRQVQGLNYDLQTKSNEKLALKLKLEKVTLWAEKNLEIVKKEILKDLNADKVDDRSYFKHLGKERVYEDLLKLLTEAE